MTDRREPRRELLIREELSRVLASPTLANAGLCRAFLKFIVESTLAENTADLKESVLGVRVFGREPGYDQKLDPTVRMTARRLREKLEAYYQTEQTAGIIRIDLPKGSYIPQFIENPQALPPVAIRPAAPPWNPPWKWLGLAVAVVVAVAFRIYLAAGPSPEGGAISLLDASRFTNLPGHVYHPAFSPDGGAVAFDWSGPRIYVQRLDADAPSRITTANLAEASPCWSPDGGWIAFVRRDGTKASIIAVPTAGTGEKTLAVIDRGVNTMKLDWSPDGNEILTSEVPSSGPPAIIAVSVKTGVKRWVTHPPADSLGDAEAAFSPDGTWIAFRRTEAVAQEDVYLVKSDGNGLRRLTKDRAGISGLAWTADGRSLVVSSKRAGSVRTLWRVPLNGGNPVRLTSNNVDAGGPAVARTGNRLAFIGSIFDVNIWSFPLDGSAPGQPLSFNSTLLDSSPQFSPDGTHVAFRSTRAGTDDVWVSDLAGKETRRLTKMGTSLTGSPRWSPDGKRLALESRSTNKPRIWVIDSNGDGLKPLTEVGLTAILPSWSHDGRSIYFSSNASGRWQVWREPVTGGKAEQLTSNGGFASFESADGLWLYFSKTNGARGIWKLPLGNPGPEQLVVPALDPDLWGNWALGTRHLYYLARIEDGGEHRVAVEEFDLTTQKVRELTRLTAPPASGDSGLSVDPAETHLLYCQVDADTSNVLLVQRFY